MTFDLQGYRYRIRWTKKTAKYHILRLGQETKMVCGSDPMPRGIELRPLEEPLLDQVCASCVQGIKLGWQK